MFSAVSVCLFVCQPITSERLNIGWLNLAVTKISPEFECQDERSRSPGIKNEKVRHFVRSHAAFFSGAFLGGAVWWENQHMLSSSEHDFLIWQVIAFGIVILYWAIFIVTVCTPICHSVCPVAVSGDGWTVCSESYSDNDNGSCFVSRHNCHVLSGNWSLVIVVTKDSKLDWDWSWYLILDFSLHFCFVIGPAKICFCWIQILYFKSIGFGCRFVTRSQLVQCWVTTDHLLYETRERLKGMY